MIPQNIKKLFKLTGNGHLLEGGQSTSVKFDRFVVKPIDDPDYYNFASHVIDSLSPSYYRVSKPICSIKGNYVEEGFGASNYEPGYHVTGRIDEILKVSAYFHHDLDTLKINVVPKFNNPWAKAQELLWHGAKLPEDWSLEHRNFGNYLLGGLPPTSSPYQLIHADFGGNVLFHDTLTPLVIDFSPAFAPVEFANAIIVCDSIAWDAQPMETLKLLTPEHHYKPFIKYAVAFRLLTLLFFENTTQERLTSECDAYMPIWDLLS